MCGGRRRHIWVLFVKVLRTFHIFYVFLLRLHYLDQKDTKQCSYFKRYLHIFKNVGIQCNIKHNITPRILRYIYLFKLSMGSFFLPLTILPKVYYMDSSATLVSSDSRTIISHYYLHTLFALFFFSFSGSHQN